MSKNKPKRRKRRTQKTLFIAMVVYILLILILLLCLTMLARQMKGSKQGTGRTETELDEDLLLNLIPDFLLTDEPQTEKLFGSKNEDASAPETQAAQSESETETERSGVLTAKDLDLQEEDIYTFLQGPKAWKSRADWSGSWNSVVYADQEFSVFGCGLCDLANIYSTLTPYDCSPLDMLDFADEVTDYHPVSGFGAIDWPYMKQTLEKTGIYSKLKRKDKTYEKFRDSIASGITAIALVSSANDSTYWQNVSGHYVNIWLYNRYDETVMIADSGDPSHNRQRIPLKYVYDALKTSGRYQYLLVTSVDRNANTWQHDGINIKWKKPKYYNK